MKGKRINDVYFQKESQLRKRHEQKYGEKTDGFACLMCSLEAYCVYK